MFQIREGEPECRWLHLNGQISEEKAPSTARSFFSLCNMNDEFIFLLGSGTAERFNIKKKIWETLPDMAIERQGAASCALNGSVFVFFGQDDNQEPLSSFEKLINANKNIRQMEFLLVETNMDRLSRWLPAVAPINAYEIAILGGFRSIDDVDSCLGDVYLFNTLTDDFEQRVKN